MDKRSIIGYILIGLVLVFYFYYNQPSEEQIQALMKKHNLTREQVIAVIVKKYGVNS